MSKRASCLTALATKRQVQPTWSRNCFSSRALLGNFAPCAFFQRQKACCDTPTCRHRSPTALRPRPDAKPTWIYWTERASSSRHTLLGRWPDCAARIALTLNHEIGNPSPGGLRTHTTRVMEVSHRESHGDSHLALRCRRAVTGRESLLAAGQTLPARRDSRDGAQTILCSPMR